MEASTCHSRGLCNLVVTEEKSTKKGYTFIRTHARYYVHDGISITASTSTSATLNTRNISALCCKAKLTDLLLRHHHSLLRHHNLLRHHSLLHNPHRPHHHSHHRTPRRRSHILQQNKSRPVNDFIEY